MLFLPSVTPNFSERILLPGGQHRGAVPTQAGPPRTPGTGSGARIALCDAPKEHGDQVLLSSLQTEPHLSHAVLHLGLGQDWLQLSQSEDAPEQQRLDVILYFHHDIFMSDRPHVHSQAHVYCIQLHLRSSGRLRAWLWHTLPVGLQASPSLPVRIKLLHP